MTSPSNDPDPSLADHEAESVETVARLHQAHDKKASREQRAIDAVTDTLGRPVVTLTVIGVIALCVGLAAVLSGGRLDGPLASWLELLSSIGALLLGLVILVSQRRSDRFAARRAALTLELALLADRKNAKIIGLLQALQTEQSGRQDDAEADEMATPIDPDAVLEAIDTSVRAGDERPPPSKV
jgi:uncharacterized membrane protein